MMTSSDDTLSKIVALLGEKLVVTGGFPSQWSNNAMFDIFL